MPVTLRAPLSRFAAASTPRRRSRRTSGRTPIRTDGLSAHGQRWHVEVSRTAAGVRTELEITVGDRVWCPQEAAAALPLPPGRLLRVTSGREADGPAWLVLRLHHDVARVAVRLSDGTRQEVAVLADTARLPAAVGVLVYPRELDVHRIDLYDARGGYLSA